MCFGLVTHSTFWTWTWHSVFRPLLLQSPFNPLFLPGEALAALVVNKLRGGVKVCAVKAPGFGDNRKAILQDLAILTGGQLISDELSMKLEEVSIEQLGCAKKVTVSKVRAHTHAHSQCLSEMGAQ